MVFALHGVYSYRVAVVSPEFLDGARFDLATVNNITASSSKAPFSSATVPWNVDPSKASNGIPDVNSSDQLLLTTLQAKAKKEELIELSNEQCVKAYFLEEQTHYRNLVAVSEMAVSQSSVVWLEYSSATAYPTSWMCRYVETFVTGQMPSSEPDCTSQFYMGIPANWSIGVYSVEIEKEKWSIGSHQISKCFAEKVEPSCSLKYDARLLAVVIAANAIKVVAMVATLLQYKQPALVTLGDALASFLRRPDETTKGLCLASREDFAFPVWERRPRTYLIEIGIARRSSGASCQQWTVSIFTYVILRHCSCSNWFADDRHRFIVTMVLGLSLFSAIYQGSTRFDWSSAAADKRSTKIGFGLDVATLVVLSNMPQVLLSFNYLLLNRLMTCMSLSREWSFFGHRRKSLRTSNPEGAQRSTYWLHLPLRFGIPMMIGSTGLHYLVSQSLFFGSSRTYSPYDDADTGIHLTIEDRTGLGYSQDAAQVLLISLLLFNAVIILFGRSYNKAGIPQGVLNSAVISASCHPPPEEKDVHLKPVKWGEVEDCGESNGIAHCSFYSGAVVSPTHGRDYM